MVESNESSVEDFLDTTAAPAVNSALRDEALQSAYGRTPGLEMLVNGTKQIEFGTKEVEIGTLVWAGAIALRNYSTPLAVLGTFGAAFGFAKGLHDMNQGSVQQEDGTKLLRMQGRQYDELIKQSNVIDRAGSATLTGAIGLSFASFVPGAPKYSSLLPSLFGGSMLGIQQVKDHQFESELDKILNR